MTLVPGSTAQQVQISFMPVAGFDSSVDVTVSGLPGDVNATPSSFSLTLGQSQTVQLDAAASASAVNSTVTWTGTSGALTHTAHVGVTVALPPTVSSPTRTTFIRNDSLTIDDTNSTPFPLHLGIFDPAHKIFFVSNSFLNRVEVYSSASEQLVASIPVSFPVGLDLSVANDKLYVGTLTDFLYVIDTAKLQVIQKVASETMLPGGFTPLEPITLSDGTIFFLTGFGVDGSPQEVIWNPATGTSQDVTSNIPMLVAQAVRSGDHSKLILFSTSVPSAPVLFDVATSTFFQGQANTGNAYAAGNFDGSRWYVLWNGGPAILNSQLQFVAQGPGTDFFSGLLLSRDQQTLYCFTEFAVSNISAYDANTLAFKGWISSFSVEGFISNVEMEDMDDTGLIFGVQDHGVAFVDTTLGYHSGSENLAFNLGYLNPDNAPLNAPTPMQAVVLAGVNSDLSLPKVFFGSQQATNVSFDATKQHLNATSPSSPFPGPINLITTQTSGSMNLLPSGFSFGPTLVYPHTNASVAQGGGPAEVFTFGAGTNQSSIQLKIGGAAVTPSAVAPGWTFVPYPFLNLQKLPFTVPAGAPGLVTYSVSAPSGSTTNPNGFRYYSTLAEYPLANPQLQQGTYDPQRKVIYFSNADHIEVFSVSTKMWSTPLNLPAGKNTRALNGVSLTPDSGSLAVADAANGSILVFNPDTPSMGKEFFVQDAAEKTSNSQPISVAAISGAVYFVMRGPCDKSAFRVLDISNGQVSTLGNASCGQPHDRVVRSADGSLIAANFGGYLFVLDTVHQTLSNPIRSNANDSADLALSGDSSHAAQNFYFLDGNARLSGRVAYLDAELQDVTPVFGQKFLASGSFFFRPLAQQIDVIDGNTGRLHDRISLPVTLANVFDATVLAEPEASLFLITTSGIAQLALDQLPLGFGSATPSLIPPAGSVTVTVHGNGFVAGSQIALDGTAVSTQFVDAQTLQFTAPAHSVGGVRIAISTPDGQSISLDDAVEYSASAPTH